MKIMVSILCLLVCFNAVAKPQQYIIDFKDPESIINAVFYSAQTNDFEILMLLEDRLQIGNANVNRLSSIAMYADLLAENGSDSNLRKAIDEFMSIFKQGMISGKISFERADGIEYALIPFVSSNAAASGQNERVMKLVKRYGNWYLYSF